MRIGGIYSFKGGRETIEAHFAGELQEIEQTIADLGSHSMILFAKRS